MARDPDDDDGEAGGGREERIAANLRKGLLEHCVLALLARRDHYGLELADDLVGRGLTASEGSVYPLLARLRDAGAVETRWESLDGVRPRRYYALTTTGREQLSTFTRVWRQTSDQVDKLLEEI
ncbi:transcriptional regulator, PadR family [Quadrisphaera granulorum]|uniref:PadR family transcriptional regulator n=1 Tax=Quadrisphaera granulorum TaxID=317664 RepID=A0A315ZN88_9ACTN|nr:PadR family transcriptional regulator [Quadrisphaera granulorum]PWJ46966.1 PadR family transcriptional regulator [Quadrisphaera granulorum]SZE98962.1 transcriptional regulator, PadR family [Quadrisphaera granulorum]